MLNQTIRNFFIRLEGLLYQLFNFFRQIWSSLKRLLVSLGNLLGFSKSQYFLESDAAKGMKSITKPVAPKEPTKAPSAPATTRRRPDASMDYYRKLVEPKNWK